MRFTWEVRGGTSRGNQAHLQKVRNSSLAGCRSSRDSRGAEHRTRIKAWQVPRSWILLGTLPQRRAAFEDRCLADSDYSDSLLVDPFTQKNG